MSDDGKDPPPPTLQEYETARTADEQLQLRYRAVATEAEADALCTEIRLAHQYCAKLYKQLEAASVKKDVPTFDIGDQVEVHQRILEGQKERVQVFGGTVISKKGEGMSEMFTVRRIVQGEGVERIFPIHSPRIAKVDVKRTGRVRRAKLYYLRDRVGKATRLREKRTKVADSSAATAKVSPASAPAE